MYAKAKGKYICYLCQDDVFVNPNVIGDIVSIFDTKPDIGVIGRYYYFFMDGKKGAIGTCREKNILLQSCCPSGMAFRVKPNMKSTNRIFVEMPTLVADYLHQYRWTMLEYDTVAARFHPEAIQAKRLPTTQNLQHRTGLICLARTINTFRYSYSLKTAHLNFCGERYGYT